MPENPPAFPNTGNSVWHLQPDAGMTLRDWFAGQAQPALIELAGRNQALRGLSDNELCGWAARLAYLSADAMLAERADAGTPETTVPLSRYIKLQNQVIDLQNQLFEARERKS